MTSLGNRLILHRFLCREFGFDELPKMLDRLRGVPSSIAANGESEFARALYIHPEKSSIDPNKFAEYDRAIVDLSRQLRMTDEYGRGWKSHQYLALLFCEHYLRRYFENSEQLCDELNEMREQDHFTALVSKFDLEDLRTVAIQSATGSGKTLVMHANILQYRRLAGDASKTPNNVILVTPNEQLSLQHQRDFSASGLPARLFSSEAETTLFASVEIIDLSKLAEKKGIKRVAVSDFGDNNLVLVDEGHLGATGKAWRKRRAELALSGFTFEYSATFNQIVSNNNELLNIYSKCLIFDYPYRMFHTDGYGKDYEISNLPQGAEDENSDMYLLGCTLSFYRQCRIWREHHQKWKDFNVTRPLWVFLGKTVKATNRSKSNGTTISDILRILNFLSWMLVHGEDVRNMLTFLISGNSGLTDDEGNDFFANKFDDLPDDVDELLKDIYEILFHGAGQLHIKYLTQGRGELHLQTADNPPFGVVNVGDSGGLYRLLQENENSDFSTSRDSGFARQLFANVDRVDSTVNIVIGARRFIAGWNSWRVTTMGLMHVGVGEGPEIIQMFGRGVRLKGWNMSLKRHRKIDVEAPVNSNLLTDLETLKIFGLRANYMKTFKDYLKLDGVSDEMAIFEIPVTWNFSNKDLKSFRIKPGISYEQSDDRPILQCPFDSEIPIIEMDLYSQLQVIKSSDDARSQNTPKSPAKLEAHHIALFDINRIYDKLLTHKRLMGWHNLIIDRSTVESLLNQCDWYRLNLPPERLKATSFEEIRRLENIAFELILAYITQFWRRKCTLWEYENIEVTTLQETDPNNIGKFMLSVNTADTQIIEYIRDLKTKLREGLPPDGGCELGVILEDSHAYKPLFYSTGNGEINMQPAPLNDGETKVVTQLVRLVKDKSPILRDRELFLIRNQTRGRGISFFVEHSYYPDFIIWLVDDTSQHIVFLDPKGLARYGPEERKKVSLYSKIEEVEKQIHKTDSNLYLHAYVLSVTAPQKIGDKSRPKKEWEETGVYFLEDEEWPQRILTDVLKVKL